VDQRREDTSGNTVGTNFTSRFKTQGTTLLPYVTYDAARTESFEAMLHEFLMAGVAGFLMLTLIFGLRLSIRIMVPVAGPAVKIRLSTVEDEHGCGSDGFRR
jgi:hypothetical protein